MSTMTAYTATSMTPITRAGSTCTASPPAISVARSGWWRSAPPCSPRLRPWNWSRPRCQAAPRCWPVAGLVITLVIAGVAWETGRTVTGRLLDEADASLVATLESIALATPGVLGVTAARARWTGRRVRAELTLAVAPATSLRDAHALG